MKNDRIPGLKRWKRDKKLLCLILAVMSGCFFMMESTYQLSDSIESTMQKRREEQYGTWQAAFCGVTPADMETLGKNPYIVSLGEMETDGFWTGEGERAYAIGSVSGEAIELASLKLYEGTFPANEHEIAVESGLLESFEELPEVGDTITLDIELTSPDGSSSTIEEMSFVLSGVIKNYSSTWCISDRQTLPSILTGGKAFAEMSHSSNKIALIRGQEGWETMEKDLRAMDVGGRLSMNTYSYPPEGEDVIGLSMKAVRTAAAVLGTLTLFIVILYSAGKRSREWRTLYRLGMTVGELRLMILRELLCFGAAAMVIGTVCLEVFVLLYLLIAKMGMTSQIVYSFSWSHLALAIGMGVIPVAAAYLMPVAGMKRIVCSDGKQNREARIRKRKKRKRRMQLSAASIWFRDWAEKPLYVPVKLVLLLGAFLIPCVGIRMIDDAYRGMWALVQNYGESYVMERDTFGSFSGISKEDIEEAGQLYGVEEVVAYHSSDKYFDYFTMDMSGKEEDAWQKAVNDGLEYRFELERQMQEEVSATEEALETGLAEIDRKYSLFAEQHYPIEVWGTASASELARIVKNIDEGAVDEEKFFGGEEAILVMPPVQKGEDELGEYYEFKVLQGSRNRNLLYQSMVEVGETVNISYGSETKSIRIAAILYDIRESDYIWPFDIYQPYTVICGDPFVEQFETWRLSGHYQFVSIKTNADASYATDKQVQRLVSGSKLSWTNNREEIQASKQNFYLTCYFYGMLCGMAEIVVLLILYGVEQINIKQEAERRRVFFCLGIKPVTLKGIHYLKMLIPLAASILIGILMQSAYYTWKINRNLAEIGRRISFSIRVGFENTVLAAYCLIFLGIGLLLAMALQKKAGGDRDE